MEKALALLVMLVAGCHYILANPVELDLTAPPCEWENVLDALTSNHPVKSAFEEYRSNPFHKRDRRFKGEIFWHPDFGLSLHYSSPSEIKINISDQQVILFRSNEPPRKLDIDEENPAMAMIFKLFEWDIASMNQNFSISGELTGSQWEILLRPKDEQTRRKLSQIDLIGSGDLLQSIRMDFSGGREVRIKLLQQEYPWQPDPGFLHEQYEASDDQG